MIIETVTKITEEQVGIDCDQLCVSVRHDEDYEYTFDLTFGCQQIFMTIDDLKKIRRIFSKALSVAKEAHK